MSRGQVRRLTDQATQALLEYFNMKVYPIVNKIINQYYVLLRILPQTAYDKYE